MSGHESAVVLGVDTGGTYTDAVVHESRAASTGEVLGKAKAPTDHDDLSVGIDAAIGAALAAAALPPDRVAMVSLSTTLATNALVEGRGRPAALVMIGFDDDAADRGGVREALGRDPLIMVAGGHTPHGDEAAPLDTAALAHRLDEVTAHVDAVAVTAQFGVRNPDHELAARELIRSRTGLPVTCSHELAESLNGPKRSVTALLNARLIALVDELVATTRHTLGQRGIAAPLMIMRGNGSLVSADFVRDRPVETILSGPAASLTGAAHLAGAADALVADIGGTTTDIAVLRDGRPDVGADGATVGGHHTMVEAVRMHTHGLGGDSVVDLADRAVGCELQIGPERVVPLVQCAVRHGPALAAALNRQLRAEPAPGEWAARFLLTTARTAAATATADRSEQTLLAAVTEAGPGPVGVEDVMSGRVARLAMERLVARGVLRMAGFTPTDASHVLGTQHTHDPGPALLAADVLRRRQDRNGRGVAASAEEFARAVVDRLARRSAEVLLAAAFARDGLPPDAARGEVVAAALDGTARTARIHAGLAVPLIALGAPAATYYPAVAEILGATVVVPEHADVANAIGAAVGSVRVERQCVVTSPRRGTFRVHTGPAPETLHDVDAARQRATAWLEQRVRDEMIAAGAPRHELDTRWDPVTVEVDGRPMFLEGTVTVIGVGPPQFD